MEALAYGCGGIVIEGGWLRVLGSGCEQMKRGIYSFNLGKSFSESEQMPSYLLVADDILGGFFAEMAVHFMAKPATSFTMRQIAANGKIHSLATRSFYTGRFAAIHLNFTNFTAEMDSTRM